MRGTDRVWKPQKMYFVYRLCVRCIVLCETWSATATAFGTIQGLCISPSASTFTKLSLLSQVQRSVGYRDPSGAE